MAIGRPCYQIWKETRHVAFSQLSHNVPATIVHQYWSYAIIHWVEGRKNSLPVKPDLKKIHPIIEISYLKITTYALIATTLFPPSSLGHQFSYYEPNFVS